MSFLIRPDVVPGRLGLLVTLFLCSINTLNAVKQKTPRPDDGTTVAVQWTVMCMTFILLAMCEYAVILAIQMFQTKQEAKCQNSMRPQKFRDVAALVIFPVSFVIASIILFGSQDLSVK